MIRRAGNTGIIKRFKRDELEAMPDTMSTGELAKALGISRALVVLLKKKDLPMRTVKTENRVLADIFDKQDVIKWMIASGRVYKEEWPEEAEELFDE